MTERTLPYSPEYNVFIQQDALRNGTPSKYTKQTVQTHANHLTMYIE